MTDRKPPRIPPITKAELTDPAREVCAFWGEPNSWEEGSKTNIINTMAHHPALGKVFNIWGKHLLVDNSVEPRFQEILILRVAKRVNSAYEWHNHVGYALNHGITLEEIAAVRDYPAGKERWTEKEEIVLRSVDELIDNGVLSDETWAIVTRHFDRPGQMDLVFTIGHYVMISWALSTFGVEIEGGANAIGFDLNTRTGSEPTKSYRPGEHEDWIEARGY